MPGRLGPARRHFHLLEQLTRFYEVHFLSLGASQERHAFDRAFGDRVVGVDFSARRNGARKHLHKLYRTLHGRCDFLPALEPGLRQLCAQVTSAQSFDAILLSSVLLRALPLPAHTAIIGDTHNVEFDVLRRTAACADRYLLRQYAARQWRSTRAEEQRCGRLVDLLLTTSARDRSMFEQELGLDNVAVVPNGIDLAEFRPRPPVSAQPTILFSGLMSYYPNQQAIRWFLNAILPAVQRQVPDVSFVVAGAAPPRWLVASAGPGVEVTGWVPDIRPHLERASVVVAPLLIGGGTRVKILEAQAMAKPVVSTTLGAEGLDLRHGESALLADDAASFAARIVDLLTDADLAVRIAGNGHQHVVRHFDWNGIGSALTGLLAARLGLTARSAIPAAGLKEGGQSWPSGPTAATTGTACRAAPTSAA